MSVMCRQARRLLPAASSLVFRRAGYQNWVSSNALAQLESECERCCFVPRFPERKVTIIGAGSDVGQITALFLKQQCLVKTLALYDEIPERYVLGVANDLAHIDTSTEVEAYQGRAFLKPSLHNTDVVLICGGCYITPPCCNQSDRELFFKNMTQVRTSTLAIAQFAPHAIIVIQTPPVDCNFALCMHTLKMARVYDKRRLLGINAVNSMRANQLYCSMTNRDPALSTVAVVGGTSRCTRVPVFSQAPDSVCVPDSQKECMTRLVREADDIICRVKSNTEQGHLSIGFSTARFVMNLMIGLFVKPIELDSALVEQSDPEACQGLKICATPVKFGKSGIMECTMPELNEMETQLLQDAKCDLEDMLNLGRCYAVGDEYYLHPCRICPCPEWPPCPACKVCKADN
ncbi:hypothetical protein MSG28_006332 [Choristoneura fumiferana]|uniref:Uncharacterized protein n=1 Tax=Choristoneura fumiferana TaxID=7141 RepID=A0ACC0JEN1_CHOFU|nr:hypothetical protein MSG28_006332 [Choristoneura fumiferana]